MVKVEKTAYGGWQNCTRIANDLVELIITGDVGARIIHYGFTGQHNEFYVDSKTLGMTGGDKWRVYGGHRLWTAPEDPAITYQADNAPLEVKFEDMGLSITQPADPLSGLQKSMHITMHAESSRVHIKHHIKNLSEQERTLAPWAISVMAAGGTAILPLPKRGPHTGNLLATSSLALWPYTDMQDKRWLWGHEYILLRQDDKAVSPQKVGMNCADGWAAYANQEHLFIKTFAYDAQAQYADMNSNVEIYTNQHMLELESLGPLSRLKPGESVTHHEDWYLFDGIQPISGENQVREMILPLVSSMR